jgi:hypothetical protein
MKLDFQKLLVTALVCGSVLHPASSVVGLLIVCSAQIAERYFTRNVSDKDRQALASLKVDVEKLSLVQQKDGLAKAFGGR